MVTQQHFCTSLNIPPFFWISGAEQHSNTAFQCHSHTSCHCISLFIAVTVLVTRTTKVNTWTSTEGQNWWKAERCSESYHGSNTLAVCVIKHHCPKGCASARTHGTFLPKQGDKPSHPTHLDLLCICDHRVVAVTLVTVLGYWHSHSTNPTALWQSCCFPSLQRTITYLQFSKRTALWVLCKSINKY